MSESWMAETVARVEDRLSAVIKDCSPSSSLSAALETALLGGGKRLRPAMLLAVAEDDGRASPMALEAACAVECLHCYSLVHDDLPCMDNADTRRGLPSCHKAHNEAVALLAGDCLHALAFQLLAESGLPTAAVSILAVAAGAAGMAGGQSLDIADDIDNEKAMADMHRRKTGCLFLCALQLGLMCRGGDQRRLHEFGRHFGLLYQIVNDLEGEGNDREIGKITYVTLLGEKRARQKADESLAAAVNALDGAFRRLRSIVDIVSQNMAAL